MGVPISAEKLRYWRAKRVLSREELTERAGVASSTYANLESGFKSSALPKTIRKLAHALAVKPEALVSPEKPSRD